MPATGLLLWFDNYFSERWNLPKVFLDVMLVIHFYEAWLATLAIVVWHVYGTVFNPSVYPMNPAWLVGRMPKAMYDHEHAAGPRLKSRVFRAYYEDEEEGNGGAEEVTSTQPAEMQHEPREEKVPQDAH